MDHFLAKCNLCPRACGVNRMFTTGYCGGGSLPKLARAALYFGEEPCISGANGSGTVFFSGCPLRCCFCQNHEISAKNFGKEVSTRRLSDIFLELQQKGAHNINLVSPTHVVPWITDSLDLISGELKIPVVYNTGGYESPRALALAKDYVQIYLPDFKFWSGELSERYSKARDYSRYASQAIEQMLRQVGPPVFAEDGLLLRGVLIRHLVLPGCYQDSLQILDWIAQNLGKDNVLVSLLNQYVPLYQSAAYPEIDRRTTTFEYQKVVDHAANLGLNGYTQKRSSATVEYIPEFNLEGV